MAIQHDGRRCLRTAQSAAIHHMLDLNRSVGSSTHGIWRDPWKILVYDSYCRDVISPLLKVGDLRKCGITLHLLLDSERECVSDVPALYFLRPTRANVCRLGDDCAKALYQSFDMNFTPGIPRLLLEELASRSLECGAQMRRISDQHLNFASLEDGFFSLLLPRAYLQLNSPDTTLETVAAVIDEIVAGLFSVIVTLGPVPMLRYPKGGAAEMVASRLGRRLHAELKGHPGLFGEGTSASSLQRPLLVIAERAADTSIMIQHSWSYCALCHDVLDLRLNRLSVQTDLRPGEGATRRQFYDLHGGDLFWKAHLGAPFQVVASDIDKELGEYRAAMAQINADARSGSGGEGGIPDRARSIASSINALPELQEKKRIIDVHMNIATELLSHIKARSLDSYFAIEDALMAGGDLLKEDRATLSALIDTAGTAEDRLRLFLLLVLHPMHCAPDELEAKATALRMAGVDLSAYAQVKRFRVSRYSSSSQATPSGSNSSSTSGQLLSRAMGLAGQVGAGSNLSGVGSALAAGIMQMSPSRRETPILRALAALMDSNGAGEDGYAHLDPRLAAVAAAPVTSRSRGLYSTPFLAPGFPHTFPIVSVT